MVAPIKINSTDKIPVIRRNMFDSFLFSFLITAAERPHIKIAEEIKNIFGMDLIQNVIIKIASTQLSNFFSEGLNVAAVNSRNAVTRMKVV